MANPQKWNEWRVMVQLAASRQRATCHCAPGDGASLPARWRIAQDARKRGVLAHDDALEKHQAFTLSIPSAGQHRDRFPGPGQVLKKDFFAVWLRHFNSSSASVSLSEYKHTARQEQLQNGLNK